MAWLGEGVHPILCDETAKDGAPERYECGWLLDVELEEENVSVFDDVLFALGAEEAGFFDGLLAAVLEEVGRGVTVGFDETLFEVGVDDAGCARGLGAAADGPGADLLDACGEVGDEVEEAVGGVDEAV